MAKLGKTSRLLLQHGESDIIVDMRKVSLPAVPAPDDGYDPRLYRKPEKPIKLWMAYLNVIRLSFGAGVLGIPQAVSQCGLVLGPIITVLTGLLIVHSHYTLIWSLNEISRQLKTPYTSFRYGFRIALHHGPRCFKSIGNRGVPIINFFMFLSQLAICCVFLIFTTDSLRDLLDWASQKKALMFMFLPYILMEYFMTDLKIISMVSMLEYVNEGVTLVVAIFAGNALNLLGLILVFYLIFDEPHSDSLKLWSTEILPITFGIGMNMFNLNACAVVLSLDRALQDPYVLTKPLGILNVGVFVTTFVAAIFGPLGYWSFDAMEDNILRALPYDNIVSMIAIGVYMVAIALAYPIQCHPGVEICMEWYRKYNPVGDMTACHEKVAKILCRLAFVLLTFIICYVVPYQGPFVAFAGNLCTSLLVVVFPAMMELAIMYPGPYGKYHYYFYKDMILIIMGTVTSMVGAVQCGYLLYIRTLFMKSSEDDEDLE